MIEELERYARESKVDDLFRDMMTGCFRTRPNAPVRFVLEYLANEYPEESLEHARAYVDLRDGVPGEKTREAPREDAGANVVVVEEPPREEVTRVEEEDVEEIGVEDAAPAAPAVEDDGARRMAPATADEDDVAPVLEPALMKQCDSVLDEDEEEPKLVVEDEKVSDAPIELKPCGDTPDES